jgi:hypothetical protein
VATQIPWWPTPVIAGVFLLLGVAISQFIALYVDRIKRSREDDYRLVQEQMKCYIQFLDASHAWMDSVKSSLANDGGDPTLASRDFEKAFLQMQIVGRSEMSQQANLVWIQSLVVRDTAVLLIESRLCHTPTEGEHAKRLRVFEGASEMFAITQGDFVRNARKALGVDEAVSNRLTLPKEARELISIPGYSNLARLADVTDGGPPGQQARR